MSTQLAQDIRIGTLVRPDAGYIQQVVPHGFESISITFWQNHGDTDLTQLASEVNEVLSDTPCVVSSLGVFGNPLMDDENAELTRKSWEACIDAAGLFGCDIVAGFADYDATQEGIAVLSEYLGGW